MGPRKEAVSKGPRSNGGKGGKGGKTAMKAGGKGGKPGQSSTLSKKFTNNVRGMALLHKFGQNLLKNQGICVKIVKAAELAPSDRVLEIGPGTGNITILMLPQCRKLTAVDIDQRMIAELKKRCAAKGYQNLEAKFGDAMKTDLPQFDVLAANMPYQISSPFIFRLVNHLTNVNRFKRAVMMFQKEFSERLMARPGDKHYCRLAINVQMFFKVFKVCDVGRNNFNPPPKVDSMVVKLEPRRDTPQIDYRQWDALLRIIFSRKNRELRASLCGKSVADQMIHLNSHLFNGDLMKADAEGKKTIMKEFRCYIESVLDETEVQLKEYGNSKMMDADHVMPSGEKVKGSTFKEKRARMCSRVELLALFTNFMARGISFCTTSLDDKKQLPDLFTDHQEEGDEDDVMED